MVTTSDALLTVGEAARLCHRTPETVRRWIWAGKVPAQKLGNQLFVRRSDLPGLADEERERRRAAFAELLARIDANRERIYQRVGLIDVQEALDRSRESHPKWRD